MTAEDVTREHRLAAIGNDINVLGDIRAIEPQRIEAAASIDHIAAVTGIPDEGVIAIAERRDVVALAANHRVVAGAADQRVGPGTAGDRVIACPAIKRQMR